jgi:hypothetical protein
MPPPSLFYVNKIIVDGERNEKENYLTGKYKYYIAVYNL